MAEEQRRRYTVKTSDDKTYEVDDDFVSRCGLLKRVFHDDGVVGCAIPLPAVDSKILEKVIEYCEKQSLKSKGKGKYTEHQSMEDWEAEFLGDDTTFLFYFIKAVHYLEQKELLDKMCRHVAKMMEGKSVEEIREKFSINKDNWLSPEKEQAIREEYYWAFNVTKYVPPPEQRANVYFDETGESN